MHYSPYNLTCACGVPDADYKENRECKQQADQESQQDEQGIKRLQYCADHGLNRHTGKPGAANQLAERPGYADDNNDQGYEGVPEQTLVFSSI